jgi:hypothetical protein
LRAGKLFFWGLGLNVAGRLVQTMSGPRIWILYGKAERSPLPYWSAGKSVGQVIAVFGGSLMALAAVVVLTRFTKTKMPTGTSTAAVVMIEIAVFAFWVLLPLLLVALLTVGDSSAVDAAAANRGGHGFVAQLFGAVRYNFPLVPLFILGAVPTLLRRWLPWADASPRFRSLVPSWLAYTSAILAWLYIIFLHFSGGALAKLSLGTVIIGGFLLLLNFLSFFQFVARSGWEDGAVRMLDPVRWGSAFRDFLEEVRKARASRDSGKVGEPGQTHDPSSGS